MVSRIKKSMRIAHSVLDSDIQDNINACLLDMERVGIVPCDGADVKDNALIYKAVELFCKWQYNYLDKGEQYQKNYEALRNSLSMAGDYNV